MKSKIVHLSKYYKPYKGGLESVVEQIAETSSNLNVLVIAYSDNKCKRAEIINGVQVLRSSCQFKVSSAGFSVGYIIDVIKNCNKNLLHVHFPNPLASLAILIASFFIKDPLRIVIHWHSDIVRQKGLLKFYRPLQSWVLRKSLKIIVTSQTYLDSSACLSQFKEKCEVIPIGIDTIKNNVNISFVDDLKKKYQNKKIIFALGRHIYYKGFECLINAVAHVDQAVLLLGGVGPDTEKYRSLVNKNELKDKVYFLGKISEEYLASYYHAADVFCLPSNEKSEAFGVVQLEAMSVGTPVISANITGSGVPWVNAHMESGLIFEPNNVKSLSDSLNLIIESNALRNDLSLGAKRRFDAYFTKDKSTKAVFSIYKKLLIN